MNGHVKVVDREPCECDDKEIGDFMAFVLADGEVTSKGLEDNIRSAVRLIFIYSSFAPLNLEVGA